MIILPKCQPISVEFDGFLESNECIHYFFVVIDVELYASDDDNMEIW